jgi:hypothetical protein
MLGEQVRMLKAPGEFQSVNTPEAAGVRAGIKVRVPAWLPVGLELRRTEVLGEQTWSVTASTEKLQRVLETFGIDDLSVPGGIDGQQATIYIPSVVRLTYGDQPGHVVLVEARRPVASLPTGVDLSRLAEIGLRVLGIERVEAYRLAQNIDWRTTLVVAVPADVSVFRQVDIHGGTGLLVETVRKSSGKTFTGALPMESQLMWSSGDSVFALIGDLRPEELFEMAESVQ